MHLAHFHFTDTRLILFWIVFGYFEHYRAVERYGPFCNGRFVRLVFRVSHHLSVGFDTTVFTADYVAQSDDFYCSSLPSRFTVRSVPCAKRFVLFFLVLLTSFCRWICAVS